MQFEIVSLSVTKEHIARLHVAGCKDVAKDSSGHGDIVETIVADNAAQAVNKYLSNDLAEMGYSASDVLIVNCAKNAKEKAVAEKKVVRIRPTTQTPARGFVKKTRITKVDSGENIEVQRNKRAALVTEKQASKASRVREALKAGATLVEIANDADLGVTYAYAWDVMSAMVKAGNLDPKAARAAR